MELRRYFQVFKHQIWIVLLVMLIGGGLTFSFDRFLTVPRYMATATLRVAAATTGVVDYSSFVYYERLMNTYIKMAVSQPIMAQLRAELNRSDIQPENIFIVALTNTELIQVTVDVTDPKLAQDAANKLAEIMMRQSEQLLIGGPNSALDILQEQLTQAEQDLQENRAKYEALLRQVPTPDSATLNMELSNLDFKERTYNQLLDRYEQMRLNELTRSSVINLVDPATFPAAPYKPRTVRDVLLGLAAGFMLGVGVIFLKENLNPVLYQVGDLEAMTDLPVLAKVPRLSWPLFSPRKKASFFLNGNSVMDDALSPLRIELSIHSHERRAKVVAVTSAVPLDGKTTMTSGLGRALFNGKNRILLVDADLRNPTLNGRWNILSEPGFTNVLRGNAPVEKAVQSTPFDGIKVMAGGAPALSPTQLLTEERLSAFIAEMSESFDAIVFDTPGILSAPETGEIIRHADVVVFVATQGKTRLHDIEESLAALQRLSARKVVLVLNQSRRSRSGPSSAAAGRVRAHV